MLRTQPSITIRGTFDEVVSHRDEIPPDAVVELRVYEEQPEADTEQVDFGGKSVADRIREIGFIESSGPSDMARHPEKYMKGFGATKNPRIIEP